jgi:UDP-N-acetylmuramoylalanine--D-glutamate ligase
MDLRNQLVAVCGMQMSGIAAVKLLRAHGALVRAVDQKPAPEIEAQLRELGVPLAGQNEAAFADVNRIVLSPGVPPDLEVFAAARGRGVPVIGDVELAGYFLKGPVIGITGTNGKTTTTSLVGHILREAKIHCQVGGNIGYAPCAMVETSAPERWNVLELSSFQLETIDQFCVHVAVGLNVTDNHIDRHKTFANYVAAKRRLFETQEASGHAILNAGNAVCVSYAEVTRAQVHWFSSKRTLERGAWLSGGTILLDGAPLIDAASIRLRGRHNLENVMAAALAAHLAGAPLDRIAAAAATFQPIEHRLEFVAAIDGVDYFNDSKATSVDAALKALEAFPGRLWVILGGHHKGSDYTVMRRPLHEKARMALLIGEALPILEEQLRGAVPLLACETLEAAVAAARRQAQPGDTVLLAPACSSFDQFTSYEHRGRVFKSLVKAAAGGGAN